MVRFVFVNYYFLFYSLEPKKTNTLVGQILLVLTKKYIQRLIELSVNTNWIFYCLR